MFLNQLNDNEKEAFVSLCIHAAKANNDFATEERNMIAEYCKEMNIVFFDAETCKSIEDIKKLYMNSDVSVKRIVLLEVLGLMYSDGVFDNDEETFVKELALGIGLTEEDIIIQTSLLNRYIELSKDMVKAINL